MLTTNTSLLSHSGTNSTSDCSCHIHTFENGLFSLAQYATVPTKMVRESGHVGGCNYVDVTGIGAGNSWTISTSRKGPIISNKTFYNDVLSSGSNQSQYISFAPSILLRDNITYTVKVILSTTGNTCASSTLKLDLVEKALTEDFATGTTSVLDTLFSEAQVKQEVEKELSREIKTVACPTFAANEFNTGGNRVTISNTYTHSGSSKLGQLRLLDATVIPSEADGHSHVRIHDIIIEPSSYPLVPLQYPEIRPTVTNDSGSGNGKIEVELTAGLGNCLWCWGGKKAAYTPNLENLSSGLYRAKVIDLSEGYILPMASAVVKKQAKTTKSPFVAEGPLAIINVNFWKDCKISRLGDTLWSDIRTRTHVCTKDLMFLAVSSFLWENIFPGWWTANSNLAAEEIESYTGWYSDGSGIDSINYNGRVVTSSPVQTGAPSIPAGVDALEFALNYEDPETGEKKIAYPCDLDDDFASKIVEKWGRILEDCEPCLEEKQGNWKMLKATKVWNAQGQQIWNDGLKAVKNKSGYYIGYKAYPFPTVVEHKSRLYLTANPKAVTQTEPGTSLGRAHWQLITPAINDKILDAKLLENLRNKSIFTLGSSNKSLTSGQAKVGRNINTLTLQLENNTIVKSEAK